MVKVGGKRGILIQFDKIDDATAEVFYKTPIPAFFYDKDLKENIKNGEGVKLNLIVPLKQVVFLYLKAKTFDESFRDGNDTIIFQNGDKKILFYRHQSKPYNLTVKGIDYTEKVAGISYIDTTNYAFILFLSYLKTFLQKYTVLSFNLTNEIEIQYNREDKILTVIDDSVDKVHYIPVEEINTVSEILDNYYESNMLYTHSLTPDQNIFIDKSETFYINERKFDLTVFKQLIFLTRI